MPAQPKLPRPHQKLSGGLITNTKTLIDMTLPATDLHVRRTMGLTMAKLSEFQIALEAQFTIEIVLAELLNNIVEHGYPDNDSGEIHLKTTFNGEFVLIKTRDQGVPMPGLEAPHPPIPNLDVPRDDLPEGQFGWFMIRELCDNLDYQRLDKNNILSVKIIQ